MATRTNKKAKNDEPTTLTIEITIVNEEVNYKCNGVDAWLTKVKPGDTVVFHCQKPFAINFKGVTPFTRMWPWPDNKGNVSCTVGGHANVGTYPYTVAVYWKGKVYVDDPDLVVPSNPAPAPAPAPLGTGTVIRPKPTGAQGEPT